MAYTEKELRGHIREIQNYLRGIAQANSNIPLIVPSGVFDNETKEAVEAFQKEYGLPVTGEVDRATWNSIVEQYTIVEKYYGKGAAIYPFKSGSEVIKPGEKSYRVYLIQTMLNTINEGYENMILPEINGSFDRATRSAVEQLQSATGLPVTGSVDIDTWNVLASAYNVKNAQP